MVRLWGIDPLFLLLVFLGFRLRSGRSLWFYGILLGFFSDLGTGALMGGFACAFGLIGWILGMSRHLVEREDPFIQGIWVALLTGFLSLLYGLLVTFADPAVGWNQWWWVATPVVMLVNGCLAAWGFPKLQNQKIKW